MQCKAAQEEIAHRKLYYSVGEFSASLNDSTPEKVKLIEEPKYTLSILPSKKVFLSLAPQRKPSNG